MLLNAPLNLTLNGKPLYILLLCLCVVVFLVYRSVVSVGIQSIPKKEREQYPYFTLPFYKRFFLIGLNDYFSLAVIISHHVYFIIVSLLLVMIPLTIFVTVLANAVLRLVQVYLIVNLAVFIASITLCNADYRKRH